MSRETAWLLDSEGALAATTGVPGGVREVLQRRIARLPATAQTMLRQAAVIGAETSIDVLADAAGAAEDVALDAVEAALVGDTLYDGLSRLRRSRLHARAAQAIERRSPADVSALAYHFSQSGSDPAGRRITAASPLNRPNGGSHTMRRPVCGSRRSAAWTRPAVPIPGTGCSWYSAWFAPWPAPVS